MNDNGILTAGEVAAWRNDGIVLTEECLYRSHEALRRQVATLRDALANACPEIPMNQDEQGGCVWCGGDGKRKVRGGYRGSIYATADPADHAADCEWVAARALLAADQDTKEQT
jgi:hypothetical protein